MHFEPMVYHAYNLLLVQSTVSEAQEMKECGRENKLNDSMLRCDLREKVCSENDPHCPYLP